MLFRSGRFFSADTLAAICVGNGRMYSSGNADTEQVYRTVTQYARQKDYGSSCLYRYVFYFCVISGDRYI